MDRGTRAIVSHRLPNAEELNAGCGDWLECCRAYIHTEDCKAHAAMRAAEEIADELFQHGTTLTPTVKGDPIGIGYSPRYFIDKVAAIITRHLATPGEQEVGLNLLRQLVSGKNALRQLNVFWCNHAEHDAGCKCFWEQCEAWARQDAAATTSPETPPNAPDVDPNRKCWASTTGEGCIDPRGCDDRGCQLYADEDYRAKHGNPTSRDIRAELIAAHNARQSESNASPETPVVPAAGDDEGKLPIEDLERDHYRDHPPENPND